MVSSRRNGARRRPTTPASGGAMVLRPGRNFATSRAQRPRLMNRFSVRRTHESGSSERRQITSRTRLPRARPSSYHTTSGGREAASAVARPARALLRPVPPTPPPPPPTAPGRPIHAPPAAARGARGGDRGDGEARVRRGGAGGGPPRAGPRAGPQGPPARARPPPRPPAAAHTRPRHPPTQHSTTPTPHLC